MALIRRLRQDTSLPAVCGRVCPQESQCESKCVRGIKGEPCGDRPSGAFCGRLAQWHSARSRAERPAANGHKVAVIGAGPAGLTCAGDLADSGL